MKDAGRIALCRLVNRNEGMNGKMPDYILAPIGPDLYDFEERVIGMSRQYAAKGASEQIDLIARIWREPAARIKMHAIVTDSEGYDGQYRVTNVQHLLDDDGLKVTDLTLERMDKFYEIATE